MDNENVNGVDPVVDVGFGEVVDEIGVNVVDSSYIDGASPVAAFVEITNFDTGEVSRFQTSVQSEGSVAEDPEYVAMLEDVQDLQLGLGILLTALVGMIIGFLSGKELLKIWMHY